MDSGATHTVTQLLQAWRQGDAQANEHLMPLVYDQLRGLARDYMRRERAGHTLQPTALVHEAYLRLTDGAAVDWQGRAHFFTVAARAMRRILVDHARARGVRQRGDFQHRVPLPPDEEIGQPRGPEEGPDILALDAALERLARTNPRRSQVVELRFFGGLDAPGIALALNVSEKTVLRDWQVAKIWLHQAIAQGID